MSRQEYDAAVDSLGNLMEDVARRVTKAVQHYEDSDALTLSPRRSAIWFTFGSLNDVQCYNTI